MCLTIMHARKTPTNHAFLINERVSAASGARSSVVWWKNLSLRGPTRPHSAFGELISPRLCIRFPGSTQRGMGPFKLP